MIGHRGVLDELEKQIRASILVLPSHELKELRDILDLGHNISRSDAYALLNYIDSLRSA